MRTYFPSMRSAETTDIESSLPLDTIRSVLQEHSVQIALLFGSYATDSTHPRSDIDIAVEFDALTPSDTGYNDALFGLSAALNETLDTDDVDLVDIHTLTPRVAESVFDHGILLVGDRSRAIELRHHLTATTSTERSPRERFDRALAKINEHLDSPGVTTTDEVRQEQ